jgi:hypothetical protein
MTVAAWQAYVQKVLIEGLEAISMEIHAPAVGAPRWAVHTFQMRRAAIQNNIKKFNTPDDVKVRDLFVEALNFNPWQAWEWNHTRRHWDSAEVRRRTNTWVLVRHSVAHGFDLPADVAWLQDDNGKATVLELRGDKLQTMVPPSVHPNGELLRWNDDPRRIAETDTAELERYAGCVAALAVILNRYPRGSGNRDNICLALTGTLIRAGFTDAEIDGWVAHIASLAGDEEAGKRGGLAPYQALALWHDEDATGKDDQGA